MKTKEFIALAILGLLCIGVIVGLTYAGMFVPALIATIVVALFFWSLLTLIDYFTERKRQK